MCKWKLHNIEKLQSQWNTLCFGILNHHKWFESQNLGLCPKHEIFETMFTLGWMQGKLDQKVCSPKIPFKNMIVFYKNTKK
jgi:hypothetical protein